MNSGLGKRLDRDYPEGIMGEIFFTDRRAVFAADTYTLEPGGFVRAHGHWRRRRWELSADSDVAVPVFEESEDGEIVVPGKRVLEIRLR